MVVITATAARRCYGPAAEAFKDRERAAKVSERQRKVPSTDLLVLKPQLPDAHPKVLQSGLWGHSGITKEKDAAPAHSTCRSSLKCRASRCNTPLSMDSLRTHRHKLMHTRTEREWRFSHTK